MNSAPCDREVARGFSASAYLLLVLHDASLVAKTKEASHTALLSRYKCLLILNNVYFQGHIGIISEKRIIFAARKQK